MIERLIAWCAAGPRQKTFGTLTLVLGTMMTVIGFPTQIWKTMIEQHCGMHWLLIVLPLTIFIVRIPYSVGKRAWALILPDTIGLIFCTVLLWQLLHYN